MISRRSEVTDAGPSSQQPQKVRLAHPRKKYKSQHTSVKPAKPCRTTQPRDTVCPNQVALKHACLLSDPGPDFVPCVPEARHFSRSCILLMAEEIRDNLIGQGPPKTQTLRVWQMDYAQRHRNAFESKLWVRVWRGQGHDKTIGWALYTSFEPNSLE